MSDEAIKEKYLAKLTSEVETMEYRKENLSTQIHSLQIKLDGERKLIDQERSVKFADEKKKLTKLENELYARKEKVELRENQLGDREKFVESQEEKYAQFVKDKEAFIKEKRLFQEYKNRIEQDLDKARVELAEVKSQMFEIQTEKDNLKALEKKINSKEMDIDRQLGILEQKKKDFEIYKQSEIERYVKKEVANV